MPAQGITTQRRGPTQLQAQQEQYVYQMSAQQLNGGIMEPVMPVCQDARNARMEMSVVLASLPTRFKDAHGDTSTSPSQPPPAKVVGLIIVKHVLKIM
jgi:hypothetical protein